MPGLLCTTAATVLCSHGGQAMPTMPSPRVRAAGAPVVPAAAPWTVAACPLVPPAPGPCVTAMWSTASVRVTSQGQPLVLQTGSSTCAPTGVPLLVPVVQARVRAQ